MKATWSRCVWILAFFLPLTNQPEIGFARDFFLVIGGGYSPSENQASLEQNVLYFQRLLHQVCAPDQTADVFFADGFSGQPSLQVKDVRSVPRPNRLMAEFFGSQRDLGLHYRPHQVADIRGEASPETLQRWFLETRPKMHSGDRLLVYVAAHGGGSRESSNPYETTIMMWNNRRVSVSELDRLLGTLPDDVNIVTIMVQCHAGGFARLVFEGADPKAGASRQHRCGFFATIHSRAAAGCTPDIDDQDYEEYSSYFWAAISGATRNGAAVDAPDYDADGRVSFAEAHAYSILTADTIDLPIKTSGEFLRTASRFGTSEDPKLLGESPPYSRVLEAAGPVDRVVLERLSEKLKLAGEDRLQMARRESGRRGSRSGRGRFGGPRGGTRTASSEADRLRSAISDDLRQRWPELANVLNPLAIELVTRRADEFVEAIQSHPDYERYRTLAKESDSKPSDDQRRVKYERFVRTAENVILAANLARVGNAQDNEHYQRILAGEAGFLSGN